MSQSVLMRKLKSDNPKDRFLAIKQIAKDRDDTMLKFLSDMAKNDPDPQVQSVAAKAVKYIKGDTDFAQEEATPKKRAVSTAPVSEANANRARGYVEEALSLQMHNEQIKALRSMNKALRLNPALETDSYFISVLDEITGLSGEESLNLLYDSERQKQIAATEKDLKKEKTIKGHMADVNRATWASAGMDLTIYAFVLIFGTMFTILLMSQGAANLMPGYDAAVTSYWQAVADGDDDAKPPELPNPAAVAMADMVNQMGLGIGTAIIAGLAVGVTGVIGIMIQLGLVHVVARYLFQGRGTLPYLIYNVVSFYNTRMVVVFILLMIYAYSLVTAGGGVMSLVIMGALGLFNLYISFAVVGRVGKTYDFGFLMGCLSMVVAGVGLSIISSIPGVLLSSVIMDSLLAEMMMGGF